MKHLYNSLRTAFLQLGATAPEFDSNTRPSAGNNLEIVVDALRQQQPPFDVYAATVTFTFSGALARADVGDILRNAFDSFREPDDRYDATTEHDNTGLLVLLSEPEFYAWTDELDTKNRILSKSVTVDFFFQ